MAYFKKVLLSLAALTAISGSGILPILHNTNSVYAQEAAVQRKGVLEDLIKEELDKEKTRPNKTPQDQLRLAEAYFDFIFFPTYQKLELDKERTPVIKAIEEIIQQLDASSTECQYLNALQLVLKKEEPKAQAIKNALLANPQASTKIKSGLTARTQGDYLDFEKYLKTISMDTKNEGSYLALFNGLAQLPPYILVAIHREEDNEKTITEKVKDIKQRTTLFKKAYDDAMANIDINAHPLNWLYVVKISRDLASLFQVGMQSLSRDSIVKKKEQKTINQLAEWTKACMDNAIKIADTYESHMQKSDILSSIITYTDPLKKAQMEIMMQRINEYDLARNLAKTKKQIYTAIDRKGTVYMEIARFSAPTTANRKDDNYTRDQKVYVKKAIEQYTESLNFCETEEESNTVKENITWIKETFKIKN